MNNQISTFEGNLGLGSVRTEQIKRTARALVRRFPDRFSNNFEENKKVVNVLTQGATTKVRNEIAGYITRIFAGMQAASPSDETTEEAEEAEAT
jgi:small subunit ribosomal protein S17e